MPKCKICKTPFIRRSINHKVCGKVECAAEWVKRERDRLERKEIRSRREAIKSKAQWLKEAQAAFNAYIRERDKELPCISCGRHHQGQYHAGHYRTVKAASGLRFNELNVHKQCAPCNNHQSGNVVEYRINLIKKIGLENVEWLESQNDLIRYTIEDAKRIKAEYKAKLADMRRPF